MKSPLPRMGLGTWHMGESASQRAAEVAALRAGIELGLNVIDTAEMYADGGAEEVVREAIRGRRDDVFVVTKFYPHHATRKELPRACERSLDRMGVDSIDLYLMHWRGRVPLAETVEALERLVETGKVERWGVSNFDVEDMEELAGVARMGGIFANQVLYNPARRGIEFDLLPWCRARGVAVMAYSPLDEGPLARHPKLRAIASGPGITPAQLAIAWAARDPLVCAIPKASTPEHVGSNRAAADVRLDDATLAALDAVFPPPRRKQRLEMI